MIALRHFIIHPLRGETLLATSTVGDVLDALCYIGVNCFVLISGWFQIKVSWKGFFNLFFICSFWGTIAYLFHLYYDGASFGRSFLYYSLMPFSHNTTWWFISAYLILYLCSPLMNLAASQLGKNQDLYILLLLTIINVYFGNIRQTLLFNDDGYNASQMFFLYWIGICLRRRVNSDWARVRRWRLFCGYLFTSACLFVARLINVRLGFDFFHLGYNNVFTLVSSVCFFVFILSFKFQSRVVNCLAASALAVYLIQESPYSGYGFLYPFAGELYNSSPSLGYQVLLLFLITISFFVFSILLDRIRIVLNSVISGMIEKRKFL